MSEAEPMEHGPLRERLAALTVLPPLPSTLDALMRPTDSPPATLVAACARRDPALMAHLLKRRDALCAPETLAHTVTLQRVLSELAPALAQPLSDDAPAFDGGPHDACASIIWPRALRTACLAEALARVTDAPEETSGRACILGLLLDIGAMALYRIDARRYGPLLREHANGLPALLAAERAHFGMTHSLAGRILADAWELPGEVRRCIWLQYQSRPVPAGAAPEQAVAHALYWARRMAWNAHGLDFAAAAQSLSVDTGALREAIEAAEDRAAALLQASPAAVMEPEAFRARLRTAVRPLSKPVRPEALEWAEQALMASEAEPAHAQAPPQPAPPRDDAAAAMAKALLTPIARMTQYASTMLTEAGQADPALLRAIQEQGQHAERLLQDVLAYTQPIEIRPEPQLLNYFLRGYFQGVAERLRWRGIRLEMNLAEGLPRVPLDRAALEHVLLNLAANAAQAMGELGGVLTVSTQSAEDQGVAVIVADTGRGLDPAIAGTAFEPFVKGAASGEGPGLGLTAVRAIIHAHGGTAALEANPSGGTLCTLLLPVAAGVRPTPQPMPARTESAREHRPILQVVDVQPKHVQPKQTEVEPLSAAPAFPHEEPDPKRLLMADPDFELGELLHELLGRRGFEVVYLQNPAQALAEAARAPYGQLLVDGALYAPDGRPLAQALHEALPGARVILTLTPEGPAAEALESLSALRLMKPFPVRALLSALQPAPSTGK